MSARYFLALAALFVAPLAQAQVTLVHVHGLSYSADGKRLLIPSHVGLAIYEGGKWTKAPGAAHDYMGFSGTARYIYSSGHPAPGSGLVNPFGLLRSADGGNTWQKLGLEGESDFHLMAASWTTNTVYVWNAEPNSRMNQPGLYSTANDGLAWKPARAAGLEGQPRAIAVHPDKPALVAVASSAGVFASADSGQSFGRIGAGEGTAVFYDLDGEHLWFGSYEREARLARARLPGGPITPLKLPPLTKDAVAFIAQNPAARNEYAIATYQRDVYLTADGGRSWKAIARRGDTRADSR